MEHESNSGNNANVQNIGAGSYNVTVTDANGCVASQPVTITQPTALNTSIPAATNILCYGATSGNATVSATGGTAPYSYAWNTTPAQATATAQNIGSGTYSVIVTDAHGCTSVSSINITQPPVLALGTNASNVSCYMGSNGSVNTTVTGGTTPYTYLWNNLQTSASINNVPAGSYSVTITDANGCIISANAQVTMPATPVSAAVTNPVNILCFGNATGSADVNAAGGTPPYSYAWSTSPVQTSTTATALTAGSYSVVITDNNGCLDTATVTLSQPTEIILTAQQLDGTCPGERKGKASLSVSGGVTPYSINWNTTPAQTTATIQNLYAGNYSAVVTDANGCVKNVNVTVEAFPKPDVVATNDTAICDKESISLFASGADTYSWSPANYLSCTTCPDPVATPPNAMTYRVIGVNSFNCKDTAAVKVDVIHRGPIDVGQDIEICSGDGATLHATGGESYYWYPGTSMSNNTSASPFVNPDTTTTYYVIIKENRCFDDTLDQKVTVHTRPTIQLPEDYTGILGTQYKIVAQTTNATGISWSPSTLLSCNNCYDPTATLEGTITYTATVRNDFGCTAQDEITLKAICDNAAVYIPNTFTPNGDGHNDFFLPLGSGLLTLNKLVVYSRWGEKLYELSGVKLGEGIYGWDGTYKGEMLKPDVYVYIVEATCPVTNDRIWLKGDISLVR